MKLYYAPGACSLSPHIVIREADLPVQRVRVDLRTGTTQDGVDFRTINDKGYVPALELPDGTVLTEGPAIVQYLADRKPETGLAPANGTIDRYRLQEWLNFISTELHKQFGPLFDPATEPGFRARQEERIGRRLGWVAARLGGAYLMGERFTVADAYLFVVLSWAPHVGLNLQPWPALLAHQERVRQRPAVQEALREEGLVK